MGYNVRVYCCGPNLLKICNLRLHGPNMDHPSFMNFGISVEEGHFNEKHEFITLRQINGDNLGGGIWVGPDDIVMRIITCD